MFGQLSLVSCALVRGVLVAIRLATPAVPFAGLALGGRACGRVGVCVIGVR